MDSGSTFLAGCWSVWCGAAVTVAVAVETLERGWGPSLAPPASLAPPISPSPSSSELSECSGLVKHSAVLTGVEEEEEEEGGDTREEQQEEEEEGAGRSEEDEDEVEVEVALLGRCFSGLLLQGAWPSLASAPPPRASSFSFSPPARGR